jgi:hypothetical protein
MAELVLARPRERVLAAHGVSEAVFALTDRHWKEALSRGAEVHAYDTAFVAALDRAREQGPFTAADLGVMAVAFERGEVAALLARYRLPVADLMRVQRVWTRRAASDPALSAAVAAAVDAARRA